MTSGTTRSGIAAIWAIAAIVCAGGAAAESLTQRVWLTRGVPAEATLVALRAGGIDAVVLPVGEVAVAEKVCRLTLTPLPDVHPLSGWPVVPLVWVAGEGEARGDAETFVDEFAPVARLLADSPSLILAARAAWPGLLPFAEAVAKVRGRAVEVLLPAQALARLAERGVPATVRLVAVALGNPSALGLPATTLADDLAALDAVDDLDAPYRVAVVVLPVASPAPGGGGASLAALARPSVADYRPAERGDAFVLRQRLDWGGAALSPGDTVEVETVDTSRLHRDLGSILRRVRPALTGWDVVGLPDREPTLGVSLEAFLDYLQGGLPMPVADVQAEWPTATRLRLALANPTPHGSAVASTGNFVEVQFSGTQLLDVVLGEFSGTEYGRVEQGAWRRTVARDANAVRFFLTYLPPASRVAGAGVTFFGRPTAVAARVVTRLGDGREVAGRLAPLAPVRTP